MIFKVSLLVIAVSLVSVESRPGMDTKILRYDNDVRPDGYKFGFETSDGIHREESGQFTPTSEEKGVLTVNGDSSFNLLENIPFYITFVADDKGYRPKYTIGEGRPRTAGERRN